MLLETWQRWKKHTRSRFQSPLTNALGGGNNLVHLYLKGDMGIEEKKNISLHCANLVRISY